MHVLLLHSVPGFLELLALFTVIGVWVCRLWVLLPVPAGTASGPQATVLAGLRRILTGALMVLSLTSVLALPQRTAEMSGKPFADAVSLLPLVLLHTHYGTIWLVRMAALIALWAGRRVAPDSGRVHVVVLLVLTWTYSAVGHAADQGDFTAAQAIDWLHLLATAAWAGGLLVITVAAVPAVAAAPAIVTGFLPALAQRCSRLAGIALLGVLVSGIGNTLRQVPAPALILDTAYGRILAVKLLIVLSMIVLGAVNRYVTLPAIKRAGVAQPDASGPGRPDPGRFFMRVVAIEAFLGIAALYCAALLLHSSPPHAPPPEVTHHLN